MENQRKRDFFKLRVAMFFGYNGKNYKGSQSQKDANIPTVEKALFEGLIEAKLISEEHMGELKKAGWGRGARTDKGVHALSNGITVKLAINEELLGAGSQETKEAHNGEEVVVKSTGEEVSLESTAVVAEEAVVIEDKENIVVEESTVVTEEKVDDEETKVHQAQAEEKRKRREENKVMERLAEERRKNINMDRVIAQLNSCLPSDIKVMAIKQVSRKFDVRMHCKYRVYEYVMPLFVFQKYEDYQAKIPLTEEDEQRIVARVGQLANKYKGTHNYHNYTRKMKAKDPRCNRYILEMHTHLVQHAESERKFIRVTLVGQSFIYHQIRKIMGLITQVVQEDMPESVIDSSFFHNVTRLWLAPAHGLFLNRMRFDGYNNKDDIPEPIEFKENEENRMAEFRSIIEKAVMDEETVKTIYTQWLTDVKEGRFEAEVQAEDGESGNED